MSLILRIGNLVSIGMAAFPCGCELRKAAQVERNQCLRKGKSHVTDTILVS